MIIKRLKLRNFRSYKEEEIEFPKGIILFEGDVGSGKSSLLYAIEFALFGLGEMRGEMLMRVGESNCSVELGFEANGKDYVVYRSLAKRDKGIVQDDGYIIIDNRKIRLTSSEQRSKIIEILNFKESARTRSSSFIYRYAIFTPQEEMKEILKMKVEDRLQTLRKAFGIEDYKIAKENAKLIQDEIRNMISFIDGEIKNLDNLIKELEEKKVLIEDSKKRLESLNIEKEKTEKELESISRKIEDYERYMLEINKISGELPALERIEKENKKTIIEINQEDEYLTKENEKMLKEKDSITIEKIEADEKDLFERLRSITKSREDRISEKSELRILVKNLESIMEKGICPTCLRPISSNEFETKLREMKEKLEEIEKEIENSRIKEQEIAEILDKVRRFREDLKKIEDINRRIEENLRKISLNKEKIKNAEVELEKVRKEIEEKKRIIEENKQISEEFSKMKLRKRELELLLYNLTSKIGKLDGEIKALEDMKKRIEVEIEEKMRKKAMKEDLEEKMIFIRDFFIPTLDEIETIVMKEINYEFNEIFKKYFYMLMENEIIAKIDENFSPLVEQDGYEVDINSLSGGEKTSIALAYRIALNLMVRKVCTSMKENLLILDEPTDGFSKEQIFKLRDILNELKCDQVIIVSHEKELESFVDNIFYVEKIANVSQIKRREGS
ncbi:MAG: AAA family ATPase [Candidatus Aenigmatarchaeota archaeon]|nr:AAA family ATPase [Candidatus Aenigmarchaeota archaeon]